jgi:hypothetical protein
LIAFGKSLETVPPVSDADLFSSIEWASSARANLRRAVTAHELNGLSKHLIETASGKGARNSAYLPRQSLWSRHQLEESARAKTLIGVWERTPNRNGASRNGRSKTARELLGPNAQITLNRWAETCEAGEQLSQLEMLVLFEILRDAGTGMPAQLFGKLWRLALTAAIGGIPQWELGKGSLDAELCWQAGLLFAPVSGAAAVAASARDRMARMIIESTDSEGVPSGQILEGLPTWLATFLRAREWGQRFSRPLFDHPSEKRFQALIGAASRLCLGDGRLAFSNGRVHEIAGLWSAAAAAISDRNGFLGHAGRYLGSLENGSHRPRRSSTSNGVVARKADRPVFQSDTNRLACLRDKLSPDANSLSVLHDGPLPSLELATRGSLLLSGQWEIEIRVSNEPVAISGPWTCSCWYSTDDGDYLELQARPTANLRIERQLLLARNDDWLFLADVVVGKGDERIEYRSRLPLVPNIEMAHDLATRSCRLTGAKQPARLLPLGLPCERIQGCSGQIADSEGRLEFRQTGIGAIYSPLVIDWNPARSRRSAFWRALTVAQNGTAVPIRQAAGFRLQIGKQQWLIYRSLSRILEPRTVLGQHTMYETLIGRFGADGSVDPMVLVEQSTEDNG